MKNNLAKMLLTGGLALGGCSFDAYWPNVQHPQAKEDARSSSKEYSQKNSSQLAQNTSRRIPARSIGTSMRPEREDLAPYFDTNGLDSIAESEFGDRDFNTSVSVANLNGTEYVFVPLRGKEFLVDGKPTSSKKYLPYGAIERDSMLSLINPNTRSIEYTTENDSIIVFERDDQIRWVTTGIRADQRSMEHNTRVGNVQEPVFEVPLIDLNSTGVKKAGYASTEEGLVLVPNPIYGINNRTSCVQLHNNEGIYVQKKAQFAKPFDERTRRHVYGPDDFINAEIVREKVQPKAKVE